MFCSSQEGVCHLSTKCSKVTFLENGKVLTTGFSRHSDRQYAIWDQHDLKKPLVQEVMDSSSGVVTPHFDYDTKMVSLHTKQRGIYQNFTFHHSRLVVSGR